MERLRFTSNERLLHLNMHFEREEVNWLDDPPRLFGIKGARGVGKTTILLQHLKKTWGTSTQAIYISLDDLYFTQNTLVDFAEEFRREGGTQLYIDEVHRYPNWSIEIKNLYDIYGDLQIVFTGSSMLEIGRSWGDLSRRAIIRNLKGLSFRQYLSLKYSIKLDQFPLAEVLKNANTYISQLDREFKPYPLLKEYLKSGYYPYFVEGDQWYFERVKNTLMAILEVDMPLLRGKDILNARKILNVLGVLASSPPFKPNLSKLSERSQLARNTLIQYLNDLEAADILFLLRSQNKGITALQKPEKIYFENTNLIYALNPLVKDPGLLRETFVLNQLKQNHQVNYSSEGDFLIDEHLHLEIGGKNKINKQLKGLKNSFLVLDDIDFTTANKIPLWLIGMIN